MKQELLIVRDSNRGEATFWHASLCMALGIAEVGTIVITARVLPYHIATAMFLVILGIYHFMWYMLNDHIDQRQRAGKV